MEDEHISEEARRRAARLARQPSLWAAPEPPRPHARQRPTQLLRTALSSVILLCGPPWLLWTAFGNPTTVWSSWWSTSPLTASSDAPATAGLRVLLIWAGWLAWAVVATLLTGSILGVLRGRRLPRWHLPMPLHRLVAGLGGTAAVAVVTAPVTAAFAAPAAHAASAPTTGDEASTNQPLTATTTPASDLRSTGDPEMAGNRSGPFTVAVGKARYDHQVRRGDTLSKISKTWWNAARFPDSSFSVFLRR